MDKQTIKQHLYDLAKALLAAAIMAMIQVFIAWLSNIHIGETSAFLNSAAAFTAIKIRKS